MPKSTHLCSKLLKIVVFGCIMLSGGLLLLSIGVNMALHKLGYYINISDSLPRGLYEAHYLHSPESLFNLGDAKSPVPQETSSENDSKIVTASAATGTPALDQDSTQATGAELAPPSPKAAPDQATTKAPAVSASSEKSDSAFATSQEPAQIPLDSPVVAPDATINPYQDLNIARDQLVLVCLEEKWAEFAFQRHYIGIGKCADHSAPVGKWIVGIPGDTVEFTPEGIIVNQELLLNSKPALQDGQGREMPQISGSYTLEKEVVLCNPQPSSFDSRYFGPIPIQQIHATLSPLWLWPSQPEQVSTGEDGLPLLDTGVVSAPEPQSKTAAPAQPPAAEQPKSK